MNKGIRWVVWFTLFALLLVLCSSQVYSEYNMVVPKPQVIAPENLTPWWDYTFSTNPWLDLGLGFDGDGRLSLWELGLSAGLIFLMGAGLAARAGAWVGKLSFILPRLSWLSHLAETSPRLFKFGKFFFRAEPFRIYLLGRIEEFESRSGRGMGLSRYTYRIFDKGRTGTERIFGVAEWLIDDVMFYTTPKFIFKGIRGFFGDLTRIFALRNLGSVAAKILKAPSSLYAYLRAVRIPSIWSVLSDAKAVWGIRPKFWKNLGVALDDFRTTVKQGRLYEFFLGFNGKTNGFLGKITWVGNIAGVFNLFVLTINQQLKYGLFPSFKNYYETYRASWRIGTSLGAGLEFASPWIIWIARFPIFRSVAGLQVKNLYPTIASEYATLTIIGDVVVEEELRSRLDPTSVARREAGLSARKSLLGGTIDGVNFRMKVNPIFYDLINEFGVEDAEYFYSIVNGNLSFLGKGDVYAIKKLLANGLSWDEIALFYRDGGRSASGLTETDLNLLTYYVKILGPNKAAMIYNFNQGKMPLVTRSDIGLMKSLNESGVSVTDVSRFYSTVNSGFEYAGNVNREVLSNAIKTLGPEKAGLLYTSVGSDLPVKNSDIGIVKQLLDSGVRMEDIASFYKFSGLSLEDLPREKIRVLGKAINTLGARDSATLYRFNGAGIPIEEGDIKIIKSLTDGGVSIETVAKMYLDTGKSISSLNPSLVSVFGRAVNDLGAARAVNFFESAGFDKPVTNADFSVIEKLISKGVSPGDAGLFTKSYNRGVADINAAQQQAAAEAIKILGPEKAAQLFNGFSKGSAPNSEEVELAGDLIKRGVSLTDISSFYAYYHEASRRTSMLSRNWGVENIADIIEINGPAVSGSFIGVGGPEAVINYKNYATILSSLTTVLGGGDAGELIRYGGIDALQAYQNNPKQVSDMVHSLGARQTGILFNRE